MKRNFLILLSLSCVYACNNINPNKSCLKLVIDRNTTESELADLIEGAKLVNIILSIEEKRFDDHGKLSKVRGSVELPVAGNGTFGSDKLGKIIITQDVNSANGGFSIVVKNRII